MKKFACSIALCLGLFPLGALAITWGKLDVPDPLDPTRTCQVSKPHSYGDYIYRWPSKYDQVFWPMTDAQGIWFCKHSGFTAFMGDFDNLTPEEQASIAAYLNKHYQGGDSIQEKLRLLEGIYALRNKDEEIRIRTQRVLARWNEELGDLDAANRYRKAVLAEIERALQGNLAEGRKLEYLYVAANYHRLFGDIAKSDRYLQELAKATASVTDKKLEEFAKYLSELAKETPRIAPGGILAPARQP